MAADHKKQTMSFDWRIIGHGDIVAFLQKQIQKNRLSHAYLFYGEDHLGKETVASLMAQTVLCFAYHQKEAMGQRLVPCRDCAHCHMFENVQHPDVRSVDVLPGKKYISLEQILSLQRTVQLKSYHGLHKIIFFPRAHLLHDEAANRLLKTLEEPPKDTIFFLLSDGIHHILPTIRSRCQLIQFHPVKDSELARYAQEYHKEKKIDPKLARIAQGKPGLFIRFIEDKDFLAQYQDMVRSTIRLLSGSLLAKVSFIDNVLKKTQSTYSDRLRVFSDLVHMWQILMRDVLFIQLDLPHLVVCQQEADLLGRIAQKTALSDTFKKCELLFSYKKMLEYNPELFLLTDRFFLLDS